MATGDPHSQSHQHVFRGVAAIVVLEIAALAMIVVGIVRMLDDDEEDQGG